MSETEKKYWYDYSDKYITTQEFNNLASENFATRLTQANLANKNDIAAFVKRTYSDDKLKNLNQILTSNKTEQVEAEKKITDLTNKIAKNIKKRIWFFVSYNVFYRQWMLWLIS